MLDKIRSAIVVSYFKRVGHVQPPIDEQFRIEHPVVNDVRNDLYLLSVAKSVSLIIDRGVVIRDLDLCASWISWYCDECVREAKALGIAVRFSMAIDARQSELDVFIRYYGDSLGTYMHRICVLRCGNDAFACWEYI